MMGRATSALHIKIRGSAIYNIWILSYHTHWFTFGYYLRLQVIDASNPVATHSHVEFYTNNKWKEVFLEIKMINSQSNKNSGIFSLFVGIS